MRKKIYILLFLITLALGIVLRFCDLGRVPDSLNWDEVSWGYNAYSILKTGHDEHEKFMPMSFEAFGDYKQPVYVYLTSLSVGIFGLNSFAVRFQSTLFGSLTIIFVGVLVVNLFSEEKYRYKLSLAAMFFFAISPWSIQFSRVAFEANVGLFFVISGASVLLWGVNKKMHAFMYLGTILLVISCYSYHSNKIFTPFLFVGFLLFIKLAKKASNKLLILLLLLFLVGNIFWLVDSRTTARGRSVTFISNQTQILENSTKKLIYDKERKDILGMLLHNRRYIYANYYFENYLKHFNPNFLFITGDNPRHHTYGMGVIYLATLPLIIIGLIGLNKRKYWILLMWLLLAPLASALAVDAPNASRSLTFLPIWQIFEALGIIVLMSLKQKKIKLVSMTFLSVLLFFNFLYFVHNYFLHTNNEFGSYWQHGYKEAVVIAKNLNAKGNRVTLSSKYEQGYIFYLFYNKYDPANYLKSGGSSRIKNKCFEINNVRFGECKNLMKKGDIIISPVILNDVNYRSLGQIYDDYKLRVGTIYEHI